MLAPLVCRTLAPRGCTPTIKVADHHGRISVIGAISVSPTRRRFNFHYHLLGDNENYRDWSVLRFAESVRRKLRGPITLLWDQIPIHRSARIRSYIKKHPRLVVEPFPAYAPELNPVDYVWAYVKRHRLGNYCPNSLDELRETLRREFDGLRNNTLLLRSFFKATGLIGIGFDPCTLPPKPPRRRSKRRHNVRPQRRFVAFDIETVHRSGSSPSNQEIACAATMADGEAPTVWHSGKRASRASRCLSKHDAILLVKYLMTLHAAGYTIVTWNGAGFDFRLLARTTGMFEQCKVLASDHVDMMFHVLCSLGYGVSLDAAAKGLGLPEKVLHGRQVSRMWARGSRLAIIEYLKADVALIMSIAKDCEEKRRFMWMTKSERRRRLLLPNGWRSVKSAEKMPPHDTMWNRHEWSRLNFVYWLKESQGAKKENALGRC